MGEFTVEGHYCPKCGIYVPIGISHHCLVPKNRNYNYKCPSCKGEFNYPAYGFGTGSYFPAKCPFCGLIMMGLDNG